MGDHLEQAAKFSKSRESTLNVSDSVSFLTRPCAVTHVLANNSYFIGQLNLQIIILQFHSIHDISNE